MNNEPSKKALMPGLFVPPSRSSKPFLVYLATGSTERLPVARPWIDRLIDTGFDAYDWTRDPNWDLARMPTDDELVQSAKRDEVAIRACDLFWYLVPEQKSEGAASELALARELGKTIVASGEFGSRNIFALLIPKEMRFSSNRDAFSVVCDMAEKWKIFRGEF